MEDRLIELLVIEKNLNIYIHSLTASCCATKVVPLRRAVVGCDLTSFRKRSAHIGKLSISDGVGRGVFTE